jgi:hypothetical protein
MVLASLEQDMGEALSVLAAEATPYPDADPGVPAIPRRPPRGERSGP